MTRRERSAALLLVMAGGLGCARSTSVTTRDLFGAMPATSPSAGRVVTIANMNLASTTPSAKGLRMRLPRLARVESEILIKQGTTEVFLFAGRRGDSFDSSTAALRRGASSAPGVQAVSGGAWSGTGFFRPEPPLESAVYWLQSKTEYVSLRVTWDPKSPTGLSDARDLVASIIPTLQTVP